MLALQFATATANLASQNAFLFLTHGPIFIASSSSATLIQCGFQLSVSPLELLSHPSTRCEDDRYKVHTTLLAQELASVLASFRLLCSPGHRDGPGLRSRGLRKDSAHAPAPEWLTAVWFTMLT